MEFKKYSNVTCPNSRSYGRYWRRSSLEVSVTWKFTNVKNRILSRILKIDVFKISDNKGIGKLFSKYELLFLDQANSSSDPCQVLILQSSITRTFFYLGFTPCKAGHPLRGMDLQEKEVQKANNLQEIYLKGVC